MAALPEENVKSRFAFLAGLGTFDSRQVFCASEKELKLFVNPSERTSLRPAKDRRIKYVQYQVATKPGCAEAESDREGQERPSSSSPSVKRRSHDGVRAPQCSSMPKILNQSVDIIRSGSLDRHHKVGGM